MGKAGDKTEMQMRRKIRLVFFSMYQQGPITDRVPTTQGVTWGTHRCATLPGSLGSHLPNCLTDLNQHFTCPHHPSTLILWVR